MSILSKFRQNASDTTKAVVLAAALTIVGTGLVTSWTAAVTPKQDHAAYVSKVESDAIGAGIGLGLSLSVLTAAGLRRNRKPGK